MCAQKNSDFFVYNYCIVSLIWQSLQTPNFKQFTLDDVLKGGNVNNLLHLD